MDGQQICAKCENKCPGTVLRVDDKCFHKTCFQCCLCEKSLITEGYFIKDGAYYCISDYQKLYGSKYNACKQYVEDQLSLSTMGKTNGPTCLRCSKCHQPFKTGSKAVNTGKEVLCENCDSEESFSLTLEQPVTGSPQLRAMSTVAQQQKPTAANEKNVHWRRNSLLKKCAGCNELLERDQSVCALKHHWHVWCFRCKACNVVLADEYMNENGVPYCEKCHRNSFGTQCMVCNKYIISKGLQAGNHFHFHIWCARCTKCGDSFGDGEDVRVLGNVVWHPRCDPKISQSELIINAEEEIPKMVLNAKLADSDSDSVDHGALRAKNIRDETPKLSASPYSLQRDFQGTMERGLILPESPNMKPNEIIDSTGPPESQALGPDVSYPCTHSGQNQPYHNVSNGASVPIEEHLNEGEVRTRLQRNLDVLEKLNSGIGAAIAKDFRQNAKYSILKKDLEVRNASRLPSARRDCNTRLSRDSSSVSTSSLNFVNAKSFFEGRMLNRTGPPEKSSTSARSWSKPVYEVKTITAPSSLRKEFRSCNFEPHADKIHRTHLGPGESEASIASSMECDSHFLTAGHSGVTYPYHLLVTTNYRLPTDVDRCNLEKHLSKVEFESVFDCTRSQFYRLPQWRRNVLKRRVHLF